MADLTDGVIGYLASIQLFDPGEGDPVILDYGLDWYDVLRETWETGTFQKNSDGRALLEYFDGVGLVCRPFVNLQDTRKSSYTFNASSDWDEIRPATGSPRKYRLLQQNTTANTQWWARSSFTLPKNPHCAFSFIFADTPADQDASLYPPYVRIELGEKTPGGDPTWGIEFNKTEGSSLLYWTAGQWVKVAALQEPQGLGFGDNEEKVVFVRCLRGKLCISTDWGRSYVQYGFPDGTPVTVPSSAYTIRGTGGIIVHGLQQLTYYAGSWTSPTRNAWRSRSALTASFARSRYTAPTGSSVTFTDVSTPAKSIARYKVTLTPHKSAQIPFDFYETPEHYATQFSYPVIRSVPTGAYTTPFDGLLREIRTEKPFELDQGTLSFTVRGDAAVQFAYAGKWRKVVALIGELHAGGSHTDYQVFTGYVRPVTAEQLEYGEKPVTVTCDNATIRPRRVTWDELIGTVPLGGLTVNQALDKCLDKMGLTVAYRLWHVLGDAVVLPLGLAEDPFLWPRPGEPIWQTMQAICEFAQVEIGVDDYGQFITVPRNYVNPTLTKVWDLRPATDLKQLALRVRYANDSSENVTAVVVKGQDLYGRATYGFAIDLAAENDPTNSRFSPWRECHRDELPWPGTAAMCAAKAASLYGDQVPPKFDAEVESPLDPSLSRRDRAAVGNSTTGINNADDFGILTLTHVWKPIEQIGECRTVAGLRRVLV